MVSAYWQVIAAYLFALAGGLISASLRLEHKQLCALISFAAGTLLSVTLFAILPESLNYSGAWFVIAAGATGYVLFYFISKYVHHVCPACAASHFDADATRHFSDIATALIVALAIHSTTDGLALGIQQQAPTMVGGVICYLFVTSVSTFWLGLIMAHVGGGFIYLATHAVLGEMLKHGKKLVLASFTVGIALIEGVNIA